jgi:hypothetical protein
MLARRIKLFLNTLFVMLSVQCFSLASIYAANISISYHYQENLPVGSVVSLVSSKSDEVQLSDVSNGSRLLGVVVASRDSLLAVNPNTATVQVAANGVAPTLVSNINGDIKVGDRISVSPLSGVAMKAQPDLPNIGTAATAFNNQSANASTQNITNQQGKDSQVGVGFIRLNLNVGTGITSSTNSELNSLQKIFQSLTGHVISTARIIAALIVAGITLAALSTLIYGSIYGSIISIGRNPLAKFAVLKALQSVLTLALTTAFISLVTIYFLLN